MLDIVFRFDIEKDLKNRVEWCNTASHWKNRKQWLPARYAPYISLLKWKTFLESQFFIETLKHIYQEKNKQIEYFIGESTKILQDKISIIKRTLEEMIGKLLYTDHFTLNFTTFPRCPYDIKTNEIWIYVFDQPQSIIWTVLHELQHFMFIHYFPNTNLKKNEFEFLKESLTVILNDYYPQILFREDRGYPLHQKFRTLLYQKWKEVRSFDMLVEYWIKILTKDAISL